MTKLKLKFESKAWVEKLPSPGMLESIDMILLNAIKDLLTSLGLKPGGIYFKTTPEVIREDPEGVARG